MKQVKSNRGQNGDKPEKIRSYTITQDDHAELIRLCTYLYQYHKDIATLKNTGEKIYLHKGGAQALGVVFDYEEGTAQNIATRKKIAADRLEHARRKFTKLEELVEKSIKDVEILERFGTVLTKIYAENKDVEQLKADNFSKQFSGSEWTVYERSRHKISTKILQFNSVKDKKILITERISNDKNFHWLGTGYLDASGQYLVAQTFNSTQDTSIPTNYLIRVNNRVPKLTLAAGQMTFVDEIGNIISKNILLVRKNHTSTFSPKVDSPSHLLNNSFELAIKSFLQNEAKSKLILPNELTTGNLDYLIGWQEAKKNMDIKNFQPKALGHYHIYYKDENSKANFEKNFLSILPRYGGGYEVVVNNKIEEIEKRMWRGEVRLDHRSNSLFASLSGPFKQQAENSTTLFLVLNLPSGDKSITALAGIFTGMSNDYTVSLSMLLLAVKIDKLSAEKEYDYEELIKEAPFNKNTDVLMEKYFTSVNKETRVLPPIPRISKLEDLKQSAK